MIEHRALDAKLLVVEQHSGRQAHGIHFASREGFARVKLAHAAESIAVELRGNNEKVGRMLAEQVQGVALELVLYPVNEAVRTDNVQRHRPIETDTQEPVEAGEMVHMGVGYECMANTQELARRERREIAEIEQQRATSEAEIDQQSRIGEGFVDEAGLNEPCHADYANLVRVCARSNIVSSQSARDSSNFRMYKAPSWPRTLT